MKTNTKAMIIGCLIAGMVTPGIISVMAKRAEAIGLPEPITVTCYSGGQIIYKGVTDDIDYPTNQAYKLIDERGHKVYVPKSACIIDFGIQH